MKQLFVINDTLSNKLGYYHLIFFLVALPFDRFYSQLVLISFLIHTLIHLGKNSFRHFPLKKNTDPSVRILADSYWHVLFHKQLACRLDAFKTTGNFHFPDFIFPDAT